MLKNIYNQTITILNKLKRKDNTSGTDLWFKYVVHDAAWYTESARSAGGSSVFIGSYIKVFIPFHDEYIAYRDWMKPGNQEGHYTISSGDYIILGEIDESQDEITANNIVKVMEKYGEDVCLVRHKNALYKRFGATVQLKIEGV